jgi:lipoprotein-anchoring transpeptidase ErfK/SrfK
MRVVRIAIAGIGLAVIAGGVAAAVVGANRSSAFEKEANALQARWKLVAQEGVPEAELSALKQQLVASQFSAAKWWSPVWWSQTGQPVIDDLTRGTDRIWNRDLASARHLAEQSITSWQQLQAQLGQFLPADAAAAAKTWPAQLDSAGTPVLLTRFASSWSQTVQAARRAGLSAELNAQVAQLGGVQGLLNQAQAAEQTAQRINLDDENIGALATTLRGQIAAEQDATATLTKLVNALAAFHQLLALNNNVAGTLRPIQLGVDQAAAERTPDSASFLSQYSNLAGALIAAREASQLSALAQQLATLQSSVTAEISNDKCGHAVPSGKAITISLSLQEAVFYQDGCVVQATPITTGRALLRTPTGNFHVFFKQAPFQFISPWPQSSPFWYRPSWVSWVMEFAGGGYFLHDAPWESNGQYGPGSENSSGASHGCIHIPTPVMQWLYQWTPMGTPVIITG